MSLPCDTALQTAWEWLSDVTPLGYAFESLLVNEFNDPLSERPYVIEGSVSAVNMRGSMMWTLLLPGMLDSFLAVSFVSGGS